MRFSRTVVALVALAVSGVMMPAAQARSAPAPTPWGQPHRVAAEVVRRDVHVTTNDRGMSVVSWEARVTPGAWAAHAAVRSRSGHWSAPIRLSDAGERIAELTSLEWGGGNVSVVWEREVSQDNWQFRMRTVGSDGTWRPVRTLLTAGYAFPGFQVDVNDAGWVLLSWENGDHRVRTAVLSTDGPWRHLRPLAVKSPGTTFRFIDNPQAAFVSNGGDVRVVAWGRHHGTTGRALWLARLADDGKWRYTRIGPTNGDRLEYNWVQQARIASDPRGDIAVTWSQQDPSTHQWSTQLHYDPAGKGRTTVRLLSHARCDRDWHWCADVAMSDDGNAIVAWATPGTDAQNLFVARRPRNGPLGHVHGLYSESVSYVFSGIAVAANAQGDAVVNFIGGNGNVFLQEFARCPAGGQCGPLVVREDKPSWLDAVAMSVAPGGGVLLAWSSGCGGGDEACRATHVWARRLGAGKTGG